MQARQVGLTDDQDRATNDESVVKNAGTISFRLYRVKRKQKARRRKEQLVRSLCLQRAAIRSSRGCHSLQHRCFTNKPRKHRSTIRPLSAFQNKDRTDRPWLISTPSTSVSELYQRAEDNDRSCSSDHEKSPFETFK